MSKMLIIGDVHATPEELEDCKKLIGLVVEVAKDHEVDTILFSGDLFHTHNVVRVEVLAFWHEAFAQISNAAPDAKLMALVGNHDYAGEGLSINALMVYSDNIQVVDKPTKIYRGVAAMPYVSGNEAFIQQANEVAGTTLICHQTFQGSKYENGFFAPDGVDQEVIPQKYVISGHIHTPQNLGKVTYVGAPRWRTLSDADIERNIWIYNFDVDGNVTSRKAFSTGNTCKQIKFREDSPEQPVTDVAPGADWRIDIRGPAEWIERRKAELAGTGVRIRTFCTDKRGPVLKESEGIDKAFEKFIEFYTPKCGTPKARIVEMVKERL